VCVCVCICNIYCAWEVMKFKNTNQNDSPPLCFSVDDKVQLITCEGGHMKVN